MRASHGRATQGGGASVRRDPSRQHIAAWCPDVDTRAIIREVRAAVRRSGRSDSDGVGDEGWRETASVGILVPSRDHDRHAGTHCSVDGVLHALLGASPSQAHARHSRPCGAGRQVIQRRVTPGPRSTAVVTQNLHRLDRCFWRDAIGPSRCSASAVGAMALPVSGAREVTVANAASSAHVQAGATSATELLVRNPHTCVEHKP